METVNKNKLDQIQIVLVETQDAANVGAVCRAMKTMGITRLAIVGDVDYDRDRLNTLAIHASDIYDQHNRYQKLPEALASSVLSIGATRRRGKFRKYFSLLPDEMADKISQIDKGLISIVFGREADGLTDEELACCNMAVHIPTSPDFPSLNLSQAVQIITYTLRKELKPAAKYTPVNATRLKEVTQTITKTFESMNFYKSDEKEEVERFFRDILSRSTLSQNESKRIEKMFQKMEMLFKYKL